MYIVFQKSASILQLSLSRSQLSLKVGALRKLLKSVKHAVFVESLPSNFSEYPSGRGMSFIKSWKSDVESSISVTELWLGRATVASRRFLAELNSCDTRLQM